MGSFIEINDTLQISKEQGFPNELEINKHLESPYTLGGVKDKIFKFSNKSGIRFYHQPPVRVFLVENINGKWLYWGLAHITSITHDYLAKTTSGEYKIIYLNTPEEMKKAHDLIDRNPDTNCFN
jgi:hypothetical protein